MLSYSVTREVLTFPAPAVAKSEEVTQILLTAAQRCSLVLANPPPEIFLVDLHVVIRVVYLLIVAAVVGHRTSLHPKLPQFIMAVLLQQRMYQPFPPLR